MSLQCHIVYYGRGHAAVHWTAKLGMNEQHRMIGMSWPNKARQTNLRATYVVLSSSNVRVFGDTKLQATADQKEKKLSD